MKDNYDLIIIGAGAAGLAAAISFKRRCDGTVLLLDANDEAGRKILATGNGRCNITNTNATGYQVSKEFFESLGVLLDTEEEGRVYPLNRQAVTVRNALYEEAVRLGAEFSFNCKVKGLSEGKDDNFIIVNEPFFSKSSSKKAGNDKLGSNKEGALSKSLTAKQVILATGGKAAPQFQSTGDGFSFARKLDIKVKSIAPALTFLMYSQKVSDELSVLKGVRARAKVMLKNDFELVFEEKGEVQFTQDAISGICIFNLSREMSHIEEKERLKVVLDLAPDYSEIQIAETIYNDYSAGLGGIVNDKLADYITNKAKNGLYGDFSTDAAILIKNFEIDVDGTGGWKDAQVTSGGVDFSEIDLMRNESYKVPGLYFAGEIFDFDGPCGGFNLDFAWNSGILAGKSAGGYCDFYKQRNS